jgi:tape measure domain-containing protein
MAGLWFSSGVDSGFENDLRKMNSQVNALAANTQKQGAMMDSTFRRIGTGIATYFGAQQLLEFGKAIITTRGEFQQLEVAFTTMLGGKGKADALMAEITAFAAKTPYSLQDVGKGAKQLLAFQTPATEITSTLRKIGDLAAGTGAPLNDLVAIYGKVKAKGKIQAEEMNLFLERGIPLVSELAKKYGVADSAIYKMASEGKISFSDLDDVINKLTGTGGMFFNLMDAQSETLTGKISNLGDSWDQLLNTLGKVVESPASGVLDGITSELGTMSTFIDKLGDSEVSLGEKSRAFFDMSPGWLKHIDGSAKLLSKLIQINPVTSILANKLAKLFNITPTKEMTGRITDTERLGQLRKQNQEAMIKLEQTKQSLLDPEMSEADKEKAQKAYEKRIKDFETYLNTQKKGYEDYYNALEGLTGHRKESVTNEYKDLMGQGSTYLEFLNGLLAKEKDSKKRANITEEIATATREQAIQLYKQQEETLTNNKKELDELLKTFATYSDQRALIEQEYGAKILSLRQKGYNNQADQADEAMRAELSKLDDSVLKGSDVFQKWITEKLPALSTAGTAAISEELNRVSKLLDNQGLDPKQVVIYKAQITELNQAFDKLVLNSSKNNLSWKDSLEIINGVNDLVGDLVSSFDGLDEKTKSILTSISQTAGGVINLVSSFKALDTAISAGAGSLEKASAVLAIISATIKIISAISNALKNAEKQREENYIKQLEFVQSINLALIEQNMLYKEGNEFFSTDKWGQVLSGLETYNLALGYQQELLAEINKTSGEYEEIKFSSESEQIAKIKNDAQSLSTSLSQALGSITVKTKDRSGIANFFGAEDEYASLLEKYPELIKANGDLDTEILQLIVDTESLEEVDKTRLENLIELTDKTQEAFAQFGDYISSIFGTMGDDITKAFQDMYVNGDDAMTSLQESFSTMIENFTRDAIEFAFLQPYLNSLNETTKTLGEQYAKGQITADKLQTDILTALGGFYQTLGDLQPQILDAYAQADKLAASAGFENAFNTPVVEQAAAVVESAAAVETVSVAGQVSQAITEESAGELVGRMGAMMLSLNSINNLNIDLVDMSMRNLEYQKQIMLNTNYLPEIAMNTRKTVEKLEGL